MKITINQLRQAIRETLEEMKLGIANPMAHGSQFERTPWDDEDDADEDDIQDLKHTMLKITQQAFAPSEEALAGERERQQWVKDTADWDWDSDKRPASKKKSINKKER